MKGGGQQGKPDNGKGMEAHSPPPAIVRLIVRNTCQVFCGMTFFFLVVSIVCIATITGQTEDFPTTGDSGFRDRLEINSLSVDAMTEAIRLKKEADGVGEEVCGWGGCVPVDHSTVSPQSQRNEGWENLLIFAAKDESENLLSPTNLPKLNSALARMLEQPGREHFCLKGHPGGIWAQAAAAMKGEASNSTELDCTPPMSPITWMFPSEVHSTYKIGALDMALASSVAPLIAQMQSQMQGGGAMGGAWGRRLADLSARRLSGSSAMIAALAEGFPAEGEEVFIEPHLVDTPIVEIMLTLTQSSLLAGRKTLVFDGKGDVAGGSCVVNASAFTNEPCDLGAGSCTPCNSQWCECDGAASGTQQERIDSILRVVHRAGFANFMLGREFSETNLKSHLIRFSLSHAVPLTADNPYLSTTERAAAAAAGGFKNVQDKTPCDGDGAGGQRDCQAAAFERWATEWKPLLDGTGDSCDEEPASWKGGRGRGGVVYEYGDRPASLKCSDEAKAYGQFGDEANLGGGIEVLYLWSIISFKEILSVLVHDAMLAIGSVAFVVIYLRVHSGSWFLAALGVTHIVMSFPLAFVIYRYVFGIGPFYVLSFLSVYIILAIGADDIFVFIDAWKQSRREAAVCVNVEQRMAWVWRRAAKAMLITSATTFGAFTATALSKLNDVSTFGLFTACLVAANYFFVITYFPCVVLIYHRYFEGRKGRRLPCGCCCMAKEHHPPRTPEVGQEQPMVAVVSVDASPTAKVSPRCEGGEAGAADGGGEGGEGKGEQEKRSFMVVFFEDKLSHFVNVPNHHRVMVVVLALLAIVLVANNAVKLGPTTKDDQLLPEWHPFQRIVTLFNEGFATGSDTPMKTNLMIWGIDPDTPVDNDGIGRYATEMGSVVWDDSFDLSPPASQEYMLKVCQDLVDFQVTSGRSAGAVSIEGQPLDRPVRHGAGLGQREVMCPMVGFYEYQIANGKPFPTPQEEFIPSLQEFIAWRTNQTERERDPRRWLPHEMYDNALWLDTTVDPPRVKYAMIEYNTTLGRWDSVYSQLDMAYETVLAWKQHVIDNAPPGMGKVIIAGGTTQTSAWVFLNTQKMLVSGAIWGAVSSAIFAFVVLCISTGNPLVSFFAITNILGIVGCILGFMNMLGWELGVIESVSCTILVGLSVDYVVHLANSYMESSKASRSERVVDAFREMGITVFGGAITSLGASGMLFACWFQTFFKFGGFMFMTIGLSFVFSNFYFMPLLAWVGPEGDFCSYSYSAVCAAARGGADVQPGDGGQNSAEARPQASGPVSSSAA